MAEARTDDLIIARAASARGWNDASSSMRLCIAHKSIRPGEYVDYYQRMFTECRSCLACAAESRRPHGTRAYGLSYPSPQFPMPINTVCQPTVAVKEQDESSNM